MRKPNTLPKAYIIRPYSPADREAVRRVCCDTGFSGDPVDPLFSDRELFADFFTRYYTDWEPESTWVAEYQGEVVGYVTGCLRYRYHFWVILWLVIATITPKALWRLLRGQYDKQSRRFLWWACFRAGSETPSAPKKAAHFHFNLLPEHRTSGAAHHLFFQFMDYVENSGVPRVYGQIQTRDGKRTERVMQYYGFQVLNKRPVSKFQDFHNEPVFVTTIVKELRPPANPAK